MYHRVVKRTRWTKSYWQTYYMSIRSTNARLGQDRCIELVPLRRDLGH